MKAVTPGNLKKIYIFKASSSHFPLLGDLPPRSPLRGSVPSFEGDRLVPHAVGAYFIKIQLLRAPMPAVFLTGLSAAACQATFLRDFGRVSSVTAGRLAGCAASSSTWCCSSAVSDGGERRRADPRPSAAARDIGMPEGRGRGSAEGAAERGFGACAALIRGNSQAGEDLEGGGGKRWKHRDRPGELPEGLRGGSGARRRLQELSED